MVFYRIKRFLEIDNYYIIKTNSYAEFISPNIIIDYHNSFETIN